MQDFEELYAEYYPQIYLYVLKLCQNEDVAEEVTQDNLKKQKCDGNGTLDMDIVPDGASQDSLEQMLINKDMAMQIHQILHTLNEPYKEVFWMKTFGELTFAEIGRVHGKTESWARTTYHRAKMKIKEAVETHLEECRECKQYYREMCESDIVEALSYDDEMEQKKAESIKEVRKKLRKKQNFNTLKAVIICLLGALIINFLIGAAVIGIFWWSYESAEIEVYTDINTYERYMAREDADERFQTKWGMDETIFPESITDDMNVQDYKMVYYNPMDAMFLGHLVVQYDEEDYQAELARLNAYESTEYLGYYGVTGFHEDYTLLAMHADAYQGFVYALTDNEDTIIYVELIFCNYFMDIPYEEYISTEHLPTDFDATIDNAYRKMMLSK